MRKVLVVVVALTSFAIFSMHERPPAVRLYQDEKEPGAKVVELIRNNDDGALEALFQRMTEEDFWPPILNRVFDNGLTPLQMAVARKNIKPHIVRMIFEKGANIEQPLPRKVQGGGFGRRPFYKGWKAAHIAVRNRASLAVLEILKEFNADFLAGDDDGWTVIELAFNDHNKTAVQFFQSIYYLDLLKLDPTRLGKKPGLLLDPADKRLAYSKERGFFDPTENVVSSDDGGYETADDKFPENAPPMDQRFERGPNRQDHDFLDLTGFFMLLAVLYYGFFA